MWQAICEQSRKEFQNIYNLLNITLNERGESFYNPYLEDVVEYLKSTGVAVESQGATCVFVPGYTNVDGTPLPLIVKKSGKTAIDNGLGTYDDESLLVILYVQMVDSCMRQRI